MPYQIVITVDPGSVPGDLSELADRVSSKLDVFLAGVWSLAQNQFESNFQSLTPLAESTLIRKETEGYPPNPLVRTGELWLRAVHGQTVQSGYGGDVTLSVPVPGYASYHFEGTRFMPQRDFAQLPLTFAWEVAAVFSEFISL